MNTARPGLRSYLLLALLFAGAMPAARAQSVTVDTAIGDSNLKLRLDGRLRVYLGDYADSLFNAASVGDSGINKQSSVALKEALRLYPGFDAITASGLKYGASLEIRQDNMTPPGAGANGTIADAERARGGLYVRREWGYLGNDDYGTLRFGTQDSASALFITGTMENFNDGGWNGDAPYGLARNAQIIWPFADVNEGFIADRLTYLSPALVTDHYGRFDAGLSWAPNSSADSYTAGNCTSAATGNGLGCDRLSSTTDPLETARTTNLLDAALRWRVAFGAVGVIAETSAMTSGTVAYAGPRLITSANGYTKPVTYDGLKVGDMGLALTYAGIQVGANYQFGRFNNATAAGLGTTLAPTPAGAKGASALVAGASYSLGPAMLGASYLSMDSQGAYQYAGSLDASTAEAARSLLGQRHEDGVAAGGTIKLVPGVAMYLSYLYGQRRQAGFDFVTGTAGSDQSNRVHTNVLTLGTSLTW
jgi:hypothetical protein